VKNINVPTLVINGVEEQASGDAVKPFLDNIPDVRLVTFENSTHCTHLEQREEHMKVVAKFLLE
jgi:pimeloyl-ACP methyl ester carboxylesterase